MPTIFIVFLYQEFGNFLSKPCNDAAIMAYTIVFSRWFYYIHCIVLEFIFKQFIIPHEEKI